MKKLHGLLDRVWFHGGMEFQKQGYAFYYIQYHVVLSTKNHRKIFKGGLGKYLQAKIMEVTKFYSDIQVLEANTDEDPVHFLVSIPPKMAVNRACFVLLAFMLTLSASREEC